MVQQQQCADMGNNLIHKWIYSGPMKFYVNVCMNSFVIDVEVLWSTVDLNKNEYSKYKSNVEGLLYFHFRDDWSFIHGIVKGLFWQENSLRTTLHTAKRHWKGLHVVLLCVLVCERKITLYCDQTHQKDELHSEKHSLCSERDCFFKEYVV